MKPLRSILACAATAGVISLTLAACRSIRVEKHDPVVVQVESNRWIVADGGWDAKYYSYGVFTKLGRLGIEISTNRSVRVELDDYNGEMSSNNVIVIEASGEAIGEIIKRAIQGAKL